MILSTDDPAEARAPSVERALPLTYYLLAISELRGPHCPERPCSGASVSRLRNEHLIISNGPFHLHVLRTASMCGDIKVSLHIMSRFALYVEE